MHATGCVHCACARRALRRARTQHSVLLRVIVFHLHRSRSALLDRSWPTLGPRLAHAWPTLRLTHFGNFRTRHANRHARRPPPPVGIGSTALRVLSSAHTPQQRMAMRHTARPGTRRQRHTVGLHHYASSPAHTPVRTPLKAPHSTDRVLLLPAPVPVPVIGFREGAGH